MVKKIETIKQPRMKVAPEYIPVLIDTTKEKYGSCCRSAIFNALAFRVNSEKAKFIRETARTSCNAILVKEEVFV